MAAYRREEPDRVPIRVWGVVPGMNVVHPSYQPAIDAVLAKTDIVAGWAMPAGMFMSATDAVPVHTEERASPHEHFVERMTTYETPAGPLASGYLHSKDGRPGYCSKHLIETPEDARRFLSIPYEPIRKDCSGFFRLQEEIGDRGIVMCRTGGHPMYNINRHMHSQTFALWSIEERDLLRELMDAMFQRCRDYLKHEIEQGCGPVFGYVGPELCIPPLQSVRDFHEFVVDYDKRLIDLVHNAGGYVWCHCHGRMGPVLEGFVEMGVDCLNPLEPPPMGDLSLAQVRERIGHKMCLEGNIEKGDLYEDTPDVMRARVRRAMREAAPGGGFILCPTSGLQEWPVCTDTVRDNFMAFIEAGLEYGRYPISA